MRKDKFAVIRFRHQRAAAKQWSGKRSLITRTGTFTVRVDKFEVKLLYITVVKLVQKSMAIMD